MRTVNLEMKPTDGADAPQPEADGGAETHTAAPGHHGPTVRRLLVHLAALAAILLALTPVADTRSVWSADEGALLFQVSALAASGTGGWTFAHPIPEADPDGTRFPIHLASWAEGRGPASSIDEMTEIGDSVSATGSDPAGESAGTIDPGSGRPYIVLAKHVTYLWLATVLYQLGGYWAVIALSAFGTVAAAGATARLAALLDGRAALPALWLTGLASPLFVNSFVAWAHTPTAALAGWAAWFLIDDRDRRSRRLVGGALVVGACLFRTEAPLLGMAMTLGLPAAIVLGRRAAFGRALEVGASIFAATVVGVFIDRTTAQKTDGPIEPSSSDELFGGLTGRFEGFARTWLAPSYTGDGRDLLLLLAVALLIGAAVIARRIEQATDAVQQPDDASRLGLVTVLAGGGAALILARFALAPIALVPGLLVAFPLLPAGLLTLRGRDLRSTPTAAMAFSFSLFCGAVLATQYRTGGGGEWGGRYFAIGLPLGVALAVVGLVRLGDRLPAPDRRRIGAMAMTTTALLSAMGLFGVRSVRLATDDLLSAVDESLRPAVDATGTADPGTADPGTADPGTAATIGPEPIVVSTVAGAGRWAWTELDRARWLRVEAEELADTVDRLDRLGVDRFVLLTYDPERDLPALGGRYRPDPQPPTDEERVVAIVRP